MKKEELYKEATSTMLLICKELEISQTALVGRSRKPFLVKARALFCNLMRKQKMSFQTIGLRIHRGHCNVIHLVNMHGKYLEDWDYRVLYERLSQQQHENIMLEKIKYHADQITKLQELLDKR